MVRFLYSASVRRGQALTLGPLTVYRLSLAAFTGVGFFPALLTYNAICGPGAPACGTGWGGSLDITYNFDPSTPAETPLPAALPLFATGLGALGLLGWRRKRKAAAAA